MPAGQLKNAAPSGARSAGQSATLENPAHLERAARTALAPAIVTVRPRRRRRLGEAFPRRRDRGIERGAGLPAGAELYFAIVLRLAPGEQLVDHRPHIAPPFRTEEAPRIDVR